MRINTNTAAMNTYSNLTSANASKSNSLAKLSSGLRINKAGDDAAGLAISEKMKNQISGMTQASRNAQDGISLIQTGEGALTETHSILNRMRDLTVQASNDTNTREDRTSIQGEISSLRDEVTRIANNTTFNTQDIMNAEKVEMKTDSVYGALLTDDPSTAALANAYNDVTAVDSINVTSAAATGLITELKGLDDEKLKSVIDSYNKSAAKTGELSFEDFRGSTGSKSFTFQIGANKGENISVEFGNMTAAGLGIEGINVDPAVIERDETGAADTFGAMIGTIDDAIKKVSDQRADLGAVQNRLDHTVSNLATTKENLSEANSRITDVDMAEEMMSFTKSNILSQASTSMLAQANQMPQSVLSLLQ